MAVHLIEPVAPSLPVPRAWPCGALAEQSGTECGATPALLYRRVCFHGHARDVRLCVPHERGAARIAVCRDCANLRHGPHRCAVALVLVPEALDLIRAASA